MDSSKEVLCRLVPRRSWENYATIRIMLSATNISQGSCQNLPISDASGDAGGSSLWSRSIHLFAYLGRYSPREKVEGCGTKRDLTSLAKRSVGYAIVDEMTDRYVLAERLVGRRIRIVSCWCRSMATGEKRVGPRQESSRGGCRGSR